MERLTARDFDQELLILFDAYVHGGIDRRGFLDKAAKFAVNGATAAGLLAALSPKFAEAQQVAKDDKRLKPEMVEFSSPNGYGMQRGYLAVPANASGKLPGVLVVHDNRGLNPHIEDITRRLALDNFVAFAPDALTPLGGYPGDEDRARELFPKLDQAETREDFVAAAAVLEKRPRMHRQDRRRSASCYGGGVAHMARDPTAGTSPRPVPFYGGSSTPRHNATKVKAPLLIPFQPASTSNINAAIAPACRSRVEGQPGPATRRMCTREPSTVSNNDTTPRFDAAAARALRMGPHAGLL